MTVTIVPYLLLPNGEKRRTNHFRFYPDRAAHKRSGGAVDDQKLFGSARYGRVSALQAGPIIGPAVERPDGKIRLRKGAGIILGDPTDKTGEVKRDWTRIFPVPKTKIMKRFIDLHTVRFEPDGTMISGPWDEENKAYFEICTGDPNESEEAYMAALRGKWHHGSVEYIGDASIQITEAMIPMVHVKGGEKVPSAKPVAIEEHAPSNVEVAGTFAKLESEDSGPMVAGTHLWLTRFWGVRYTREQSEVVLARQGNSYFTCLINNGQGMAVPYTGADAEQKYLRALEATASIATTPLLAPTDGIIEAEEVDESQDAAAH